MSGGNLSPEKITSPFQLMAAWFVMLVSMVSILLTAAANIERPEWASAYLVIFSSLLIVGVIGCVLLMLTRFRPHLQDGKEYAEWLKDKGRYSEGLIIQSPKRVSAIEQALPTPNKGNVAAKDFLISVVNVPQSLHLIESLKNKGFKPELYIGRGIDEKIISGIKGQQEALWVGAELSSKQVIPAIKLAVSMWPDLKYIHLSNDGGDPPDYVHEQLFIGGSTQTAVERYALEPWSLEELMQLDENLPTKDFHRKIRDKYS
ncbi:hypothetical protein QTU68_004456 [Vibrio vulnificus]|nr:hypothetical protein [Vibrio vulnificus]ELP6123702.1 hypothetical protein [Vibrio vulnificus]ELP8110008.1 hypothetical protein [Vibrio vulnificus]